MTVSHTDPAVQFEVLFEEARRWMFDQGASRWVAEAFAHWVIAEVAPHEPAPERFAALCPRWNHDPLARSYLARHGARLVGSPPWSPGDPLPAKGR